MLKFTSWMVGVTLALVSPIFAEPSSKTINIGVMNDQSGPYADCCGRGSVLAAQMAADEFGNSVAGMPIKIISADHQNKADNAAGIARRWIDVDGVDVIVDGGASSAALAIQQVTRGKGKLFLGTSPATSDLTGKFCSPLSFQFTYDTYALANAIAKGLVENGQKKWFFITSDYAFGHALERDTAKFVADAGGTVVGSVKHPLNTSDFSSFLLQAQSSNASVLGLANAGADTVNALKHAKEFGIAESGKQIAALLVFISDVHALGLANAQGLVVATSFYWDRTPETRKWAEDFAKKNGGHMPTMVQAATYSAVRHYLKATAANNEKGTEAVANKMRELPLDDMYNKHVKLRFDGRVIHDIMIAEMKKPSESKYPYDYYKIIRTIPGEQAFRAPSPECPLVK